MQHVLKPVTAGSIIYTGGGIAFPPGSTVTLPASHADDLVASGHVSEPSADLPKVTKPVDKKPAPTGKDV